MSSSSSWQFKSSHKFEKVLFYVILIACNVCHSTKKLDCNAKSEPPYLATTFMPQ